MPSAFITWIFAKSINNAAVLGGYYGVLGGFAYASWYVSFWTAGLIGYVLRTRHGYRSLTTAVDKLYGPTAGLCFGRTAGRKPPRLSGNTASPTCLAVVPAPCLWWCPPPSPPR